MTQHSEFNRPPSKRPLTLKRKLVLTVMTATPLGYALMRAYEWRGPLKLLALVVVACLGAAAYHLYTKRSVK